MHVGSIVGVLATPTFIACLAPFVTGHLGFDATAI
jgi:hypothetical protein